MRDALMPVYEALGPRVGPGDRRQRGGRGGQLGLAAVEDAILAALADRYDLREVGLDHATLELAARLEPEHRLDP